MTSCLHCYATTSNGLVLCDLCQMKGAKALEFLPVYFRNLARWRPGRAGSRPVPGSREPARLGVAADDRVSRTLDEAGATIIGWARCLADDRGVELPDHDAEDLTIAAVCRLLAEHLTSIATLGWAGTFIAEADRLEETLRGLTEEVAPGWYAGGCKRCGSGTYVVPGLTWVTCRCCGTTTYARDHLETVLDEAREWVARPKAIAEAIVALVDTEQSIPSLHDRIRQWSARSAIPAYRRTDVNDLGEEVEVGPRRYRLGDVLDRVCDTGTRSASDDAAAS